jgi:hypothetical protein
VLRTLLDLTFFSAILPLILFSVMFGLQTRWNETTAGRMIFYVTLGLLGSFLVSVLVLIFDGWAETTTGYVVRISIRAALAVLFWTCFALYVRSNRKGRK